MAGILIERLQEEEALRLSVERNDKNNNKEEEQDSFTPKKVTLHSLMMVKAVNAMKAL